MPTSQPIRLLIAAGVVALYMALGWLLRLDGNSYLLLGIPLVLVFQLFVARRPVTELWLKQPPARFFTWLGLVIAVPFLVYPVWSLVMDWKGAGWPVRLWSVAAVAGTFPLGATLARATRRTWLALLGCVLTAGLLGAGMMVGVSMLRHHGFHPPHRAWQIGAGSFLLYMPVCFVMEEVFFRGGIDSYVQRDGDRFGWLTAIYVSCLWGWWHLPILGAKSAAEIILFAVMMPMIHCAPGIPFSLFWRRGGSLFVTATVHALIDAVRNAVM